MDFARSWLARGTVVVVSCATLVGCGLDFDGLTGGTAAAGVGGAGGGGSGGGFGGGSGPGGGSGFGGGGGLGGGAGAGGGAPVVTVTFTPSTADMLNPERGFYDGVDLVALDDASYVRKAGSTLAYAGVHLDAYRDAALPTTLLDALDKGFAAVRAGRIKVVLRFVYNDGFDPDASLSRIQGHLGQLAPVLAKNADVIAVMQAGFIGAWGEWHSSTNKLTNPADEKAVLEAILKALPASRMTQIRTPMAKEGVYGMGPIGEADAFSGSSRARIGHHNDCFLADATDMGTYDTPVQTWKDYVATEGRFVPVGGETCQPSTFAACSGALSAMETLHVSFLNSLYHPDVIAGWKPPKGDCFPIIRQKLGYRIALTSAKLPKTVAPGGLLPLEVLLSNVGFAAPFNPRKVHVVLTQGTTRLVAALGKVDPRRWEGGKSATFATTLRVPASLAKGAYKVSLWLPDEAASLRDVPEYAVQLANAGTWDAATGDNVLLPDLAVDPAAPGPVDPLASVFAEQ